MTTYGPGVYTIGITRQATGGGGWSFFPTSVGEYAAGVGRLPTWLCKAQRLRLGTAVDTDWHHTLASDHTDA